MVSTGQHGCNEVVGFHPDVATLWIRLKKGNHQASKKGAAVRHSTFDDIPLKVKWKRNQEILPCGHEKYGKKYIRRGKLLRLQYHGVHSVKVRMGVSLNLDSSKAPVGWRLSSLRKNDDTSSFPRFAGKLRLQGMIGM